MSLERSEIAAYDQAVALMNNAIRLSQDAANSPVASQANELAKKLADKAVELSNAPQQTTNEATDGVDAQ